MTPRVDHFRGETFRLPAQRLDAAGSPRSLVGTVVTAWIGTDAFALPVDTLVTTALTGNYVFSRAAVQAATWPVGIWALYVRYDDAGVLDTEIVALIVVKDAT